MSGDGDLCVVPGGDLTAMDSQETASSPLKQVALPPIGAPGTSADTQQDPAPATAIIVTFPTPSADKHDPTTRRVRDGVPLPYDTHDPEIAEFVRQASSIDRSVSKDAMGKLWQHTVLARRNRVANQAELARLGGVALAIDYSTARLAGSVTTQDEDEVVMALLVLENLSSNVQLHHGLVNDTHLLRFLVMVLREQTAAPLRINAAKVLVNLTFSSPQYQRQVVAAGALPLAVDLVSQSDPGLVRQGAWLLSHLTAGQGCAAREQLGEQMELLNTLKHLLKHSTDKVTKIRACEVVCNLARGDVGPHANLVRAGVVPALLELVDPALERRQEPEVVAPALLALAALAVGGAAVARGLVCDPKMTTYLAGILDYSNLVTRNYDLSRVMMAAHALIFALGAFAVRNNLAKQPAAAAGAAAGEEGPAGGHEPHVAALLEESGYVSFRASLRALGLEQPTYHAASLGKDLGGPHCFVANTTYQVNIELLPLLRHNNARIATNACARLYQIAVCLAANPEGRAVLANASLALILVDLLECQHSSVLQAALSLVDSLAALPELVPLMVQRGVMDAVNKLSARNQMQQQQQGAPEPGEEVDGSAAGQQVASDVRRDPLVGLLADRALVTMFLASVDSDGAEDGAGAGGNNNGLGALAVF